MNDRLINLSQKLDTIAIMRAIRHALIITVPVLMIGSFALLLRSLPVSLYQDFITTFCGGVLYEFFSLIYNSCFAFFSIYIVINISLSYVMEYSSSFEEYMMAPAVSLAGFLIMVNAGTDRFNIKDLSVNGVFIAMVTAVIISVLIRRMQNIGRKWIKVGASEGILYQKAIRMIIPSAIILIGCALVNFCFCTLSGVNSVPELITLLGNRLFVFINNNYFEGLVYLLIVHILWSFGLHGGNIMENIVQENFVEIMPDAIFNKTFYDTFVNMGGCGAALCIVIAIFICSRNASSRDVAKGALFPVIFNINEIITFGFPVIFNPIMIIPFILVPAVSYSISYAALLIGLVPHVVETVEWTTPVFLSGYVATGSVAGSILQLVCIVIGVCIYIPFIKMHERTIDEKLKSRVDGLTDILKADEESGAVPDLSGRNDIYGSTAKTMINELEQAIRMNELFMMYQPQVDNDGKCIGAEALIRWNHKSVGFIYPPLIIEFAKEGGFLDRLEALIFDNACRVAKEATRYLGDDVKISVNITAKSLSRNSIAEEINSAAARYDLNPCCIWVEITENDVLVGSDEVTEELKKIKESGHNLLIDDFSMGHTSLKYLKTQCFDGIKLDASITKSVKEDRVGQEIIASLADLGKRLDVGIIAEYVEDEEQKNILKNLGCGFYQGYLYSKPLMEKDFLEYINK